MLSLLVVDDEIIIADGLYLMLQETFQDQLIVRRCYSVHEARSIMETVRVDILMTDIEMPDVSGLVLHDWVRNRWPMVRVIYLTGYSDFEYARQALQQNALAYVLKSEGDPVIVSAVEKAIDSIREENEGLLKQVTRNYSRSGRIQQLIYHVMHGGNVSKTQFMQALTEHGLAFTVEKPILMAYCFYEELRHPIGQTMALIERLAENRMKLLLTEMTSRAFLLICQPETDDEKNLLRGLLESAQMILEKQNELMTVCLLEEAVDWDGLVPCGELLLEQVNRTSPVMGELLLISNTASGVQESLPPIGEEWSDALDSLKRLNEYLHTGQRDLYFEEEKHLWTLVDLKNNRRQGRMITGTLLMSLVQSARSLPQSEALCDELGRCDPQNRRELAALPAEMHELAERFFELRGQNKNHRQHLLVTRVNEYIADHMDGDLSLITIADAVHFHPVYLSRIYKETSGMSLSDYIANQRLSAACSMLRSSQLQISAIARATGFTSSNYFSRWFRKRVGITPQEYRDKAMNTK